MTYKFPVYSVIHEAKKVTGFNFPTPSLMEDALRNSPRMINVIHDEAMKVQGRHPDDPVNNDDYSHYAIEELLIDFTLSLWFSRGY